MLDFAQPILVRRAVNPAEMVASGESMLLGYTTAAYEGSNVIASAPPSVHSLIGGAAEPRDFVKSTLAVVENQDGTFTGSVTDEGAHHFTWTIELPPLTQPDLGGVAAWTSSYKPAKALMKQIYSPRYVIGNTLRPQWQILNPRTVDARIVIRPQPAAASFDDHIRFHELQHVMDHRALATAIFGPLDTWLTTAKTKAILFHSESRFTIGAHVRMAGGYATGDLRILRYWIQACGQSGDLFHATANGAAPVLRWASTSYTNSGTKADVILELSASHLMAAPPVGAHAHFTKLRPLNHPIDGNEQAIGTSANAQPARVIQTDNLGARANGYQVELD